MKLFKLIVLGFSLVVTAACGSDNSKVTEPIPIFRDENLELESTGSLYSSASQVEIEALAMKVDQIDFVSDEEVEAPIELTGPFEISFVEDGVVVDRVNESNSGFGTFSLMEGVYISLKIEVASLQMEGRKGGQAPGEGEAFTASISSPFSLTVALIPELSIDGESQGTFVLQLSLEDFAKTIAALVDEDETEIPSSSLSSSLTELELHFSLK